MIRPFQFAAAFLLVLLAGCAEPDHYPVSGQECSEGDPVQDLSASDCSPPT
ncbi:hypothetical protein [Primorskyibacter sedentarius]|uniref:hypothetical protein n=1 Tax=Primorskyibacter sedentarius TaxID=745311 RepID=UPI003EC0CCE6